YFKFYARSHLASGITRSSPAFTMRQPASPTAPTVHGSSWPLQGRRVMIEGPGGDIGTDLCAACAEAGAAINEAGAAFIATDVLFAI
ncbi:MAG TPA: hypothetical protein VIU34_11325, partial [Steroidobacter sp.]